MKKYLTRADIAVIIILLVVSLISFFLTLNSGAMASRSLYVNIGRKTYNYAMNGKRYIKYSNNGYSCTAEVNNNKVRIYKTNCPNKICAKKGWIQDNGSSIICAPMELMLEIKGIGKGNLDALNY